MTVVSKSNNINLYLKIYQTTNLMKTFIYETCSHEHGAKLLIVREHTNSSPVFLSHRAHYLIYVKAWFFSKSLALAHHSPPKNKGVSQTKRSLCPTKDQL